MRYLHALGEFPYEVWIIAILIFFLAMVHHYAMEIGNKVLADLGRIENLEADVRRELRRLNERLDDGPGPPRTFEALRLCRYCNCTARCGHRASLELRIYREWRSAS